MSENTQAQSPPEPARPVAAGDVPPQQSKAGIEAFAIQHATESAQAYRQPGCHRTSNMLDRLMRGMNRFFVDGQHLHGSLGASRLHGRAWALLWNFAPWSPASTRAHEGWRCPAEELNHHRYHETWLQNLLISASLGGYRDCCLKPQKA